MDPLPPRRAGRAASPDLVQRREAGEALGRQVAEEGVETGFEAIGGVRCAVCRPGEVRGLLVHFHGGGYRMGSAAAWRPFGTRLASAMKFEVVIPDYRLAPEHPFPAALRDARAVLEACGARGPQIVSGDSAGGGLALASAIAALRRGLAIAGLCLLSPWLDLTLRADSYETRAATDQLFSRNAAREAAEAYLQGAAAGDPMASPLFADLDDAPPTLLMASAAEVLLDDSLNLASRLALARREVTLHVAPDEPHVWPVLAPARPASDQALRMIAAFADRISASAG